MESAIVVEEYKTAVILIVKQSAQFCYTAAILQPEIIQRNQTMRWPLLVIFILSLTACGQKGDLTLPEKSTQDKAAQDKSANKQFTQLH